MSKINPNPQVEAFARDATNTVVQVLMRKTRTRWIPPVKSLGCRMVGSRREKITGFGTGYVIKSDNAGSIVLTASHVVGGFNLAAGDRLHVRVQHPIGGGGRVRQLRARVLHKSRHADVAILRVPALKNVQSLNFDPGNGEAGVIGVGFANAERLFPGIDIALKRFCDLSPGSVVQVEPGPTLDGVSISNQHMEMVAMQGMSGCPIVTEIGSIGMLITGEGASTNSVSNNTICQVMKKYYRLRLSQDIPTLSGPDLDAVVSVMTMEEVVAAL